MRPGGPSFFISPLRNQTTFGSRPGQAPLMFLQCSKALCCLNKVHLQDNKALEDTWCWFQVNGFSMAHIPQNTLCLFHPFHLFISSFFFLPHTSPSSCFSPQITLCSLFAVVYSSSSEHFNDATVWSWVDLRSHTWECAAVRGAGWLLISQDSFQSVGGGLWRRTRVERNEKTLKPQTVAEGSSLTCQGYTSAVRPDACCIKGADVQDMYPLKQIPTSEDGLKNTHRPMRSSFFHFFITHGAYVSVGHLSLKPSKDILHHCMLNGFICVQCFSSSLISRWLTTNALYICSAFLPPLVRSRWAQTALSLPPSRTAILPTTSFAIISPSQTENHLGFSCLHMA